MSTQVAIVTGAGRGLGELDREKAEPGWLFDRGDRHRRDPGRRRCSDHFRLWRHR